MTAPTRRSKRPTPDPLDETLDDLIDAWEKSLQYANLSQNSIDNYLRTARGFLAYLKTNKLPLEVRSIIDDDIEGYFAAMLQRVQPATVAKHYRQLALIWKWMVKKEYLDFSPMANMDPPKVPEKLVPIIPDDSLEKLLATCKGKTFENRRDLAIMWFLLDSGARAGELVSMTVKGTDLKKDVARTLAKGRREHVIPFGPRASEAMSAYLRYRKRHRMAEETDAFWLGRKGPLTVSGIEQMIERRVKDAGLPHIHPHQFRHTFAHVWLLNGGQEVDLMRITGWKSRQMVERYAASAGKERAQQAHKRLQLGDRLK